MIDVRDDKNGLGFNVYVQPRASKAAVVGEYNGALKIKLTAPPVEGAANKQCIQLLAKWLGVPKSAVAIASGQASRTKQIRIILDKGGAGRADRSSILEKIRSA